MPAVRKRTTLRKSTRSTDVTVSSEGKLPLCAEMCATKALLAGDGDVLSDIYRKRVINRGASAFEWGVNFDNNKIQG